MYASGKIDIPKPEFYVIYTGDQENKPKELIFSDVFFGGEDIPLEIRVKVLYGSEEDDVISQYVKFTKVYSKQKKIYGTTHKAIEETIKICKDKDIMREYLEKKESEVITMMDILYDEETIMRIHDASLVRETTQRVTEEEREKAVEALIGATKMFSGSKADAVEVIMTQYGYTDKEAEDAVKKYW